ncbi:UDP-N-acetylglucosamine 2-epimerase (non-hydrolyzing) [Prosthecobacter sp.]|uniref:non-hydrolyzing UDP-N-acetylglucosamine 2-epimerase n=1 Tax=Prosthecobacter sp. TaxID=1965333 RepID=UPI001DF52D43|nr:UDP-N-acetylglucosamine 2-epimerase (non-hydrolyzing) [Prosthecobacter sp.]MCB1278748.1 UDP-N-acetylglucosamine 2-epimerase (non-hydrolyzing) [Prosthecobacter sp.]
MNSTSKSAFRPSKVLVCLGTRPELIKFAPMIKALENRGAGLVTVNTGQHTDLLQPLFELFGIRPHHNLEAMVAGQSLNALGSRLLERLDPVLTSEKPDLVLVQGDTASAVMGSLAAFNRGIPVGHLEAGLRSGNPLSPFPEEMNRRLVGQIAGYHFAATERNRRTLLDEGVDADSIHLVGNTVVDALRQTLATTRPSKTVELMQQWAAGKRLVLVTTHRRENFGETMSQHLRALREFIESEPDLCMIFPVHPNPNVRSAVAAELDHHPRIRLTDPMGYRDFVHLLSGTWLIVSDSGGIQEEATALGKPMIVLRENTERPEAVECGVARLVGESPERLREMLRTALIDEVWHANASRSRDVFGDGQTAERICDLLLGAKNTTSVVKPMRLAA